MTDFTPTIPPGWSVGYASNNVTLIQLPTGGDWATVPRADGFEPNDAQLAMIIACGIAPPPPARNWTANLVSETFLSLPMQQRALVAPRPTEEGARKMRLEHVLLRLRSAAAALGQMNVALTTQGWFGHTHAPVAEFTRWHQTASMGVHDAIKAATGEHDDHTVWGQAQHAELVAKTEVEAA